MATFHMTELEFLQNPALLIQHIRAGEQVVIDGEVAPIAMVRPPGPDKETRTLTETLRILESRAADRKGPIRMGKDFADDLEEIIANRKPSRWALQSWD